MSNRAFERRRVGGTSVLVSALGFGGAPIGGFRFGLSDQQGAEALSAAFAGGIRYFDTSPYYGYGRSELIFGYALRPHPRDGYVLSSKVGRVMSPLAPGEVVEGWRSGGLSFKAAFDYSREGTLRSLEQSFLRLGLPSIDIALIHDADVHTHGSQAEADRRFAEAMAGSYPALVELRRAGVIKAIGVGLNETAMSLRFAREADLDCIMLAGRYTLLEQGALDELLPLCERKNMSILLAAPLNSGILATGARAGATYDYKPAPREILDKVGRIEDVCRRHQVDLTTAALQFPLAHPRLACVVAGALTAGEVRENIARMGTRIPADFWRELQHENLLPAAAPVPGLR
jgi:D-threo-aldose 1-dehydrogenase